MFLMILPKSCFLCFWDREDHTARLQLSENSSSEGFRGHYKSMYFTRSEDLKNVLLLINLLKVGSKQSFNVDNISPIFLIFDEKNGI